MTLPTPEQLDSETDRRYSSTARDDIGDERAWLDIREQILVEWTDATFCAFFPTAGDLVADDTVLIEYWNDIKQQIAGEPGRWSWDDPADPAA